MDKNEFIQIYNNLIKKDSISIKNGIEIIEEYCKINKKDDNMTSILINLLLSMPPILHHYFTVSLEGLSKYFEVIIITDLKTNKIIKIV